MPQQAASPRDLAGAILLSLGYGSVHAFAILMVPFEMSLAASRGAVSLIYSLAIASLTAGVFAAPRLTGFATWKLALFCGCASAIGIAAAGTIPSIVTAWLGLGVMFGFANGVVYSLFLGRAAAALPNAQGLAAGLVTAAYGLGAAISAQALAIALQHLSLAAVMVAFAAFILSCSAIAAIMFRGRTTFATVSTSASLPAHSFIAWMWIVYVLGASGGLMAIAHASELVKSIGSSGTAPSVLAIGNVLGSLVGGIVAARQAQHHALAAPLAIMCLALAALLGLPAFGLLCLAAVGLAYGWLIAAVPVVIRRNLGEGAFAAAFGKVFTAWGLAGLLAPTMAGILFDRSGDYRMALSVATGAAMLALSAALSGKGR